MLKASDTITCCGFQKSRVFQTAVFYYNGLQKQNSRSLFGYSSHILLNYRSQNKWMKPAVFALRCCQYYGVRFKIWFKQSRSWALLNVIPRKFQDIIYVSHSSIIWNFRAFRAARRKIQKKSELAWKWVSQLRYIGRHESAYDPKLPIFETCKLGRLQKSPPPTLFHIADVFLFAIWSDFWTS